MASHHILVQVASFVIIGATLTYADSTCVAANLTAVDITFDEAVAECGPLSFVEDGDELDSCFDLNPFFWISRQRNSSGFFFFSDGVTPIIGDNGDQLRGPSEHCAVYHINRGYITRGCNRNTRGRAACLATSNDVLTFNGVTYTTDSSNPRYVLAFVGYDINFDFQCLSIVGNCPAGTTVTLVNSNPISLTGALVAGSPLAGWAVIAVDTAGSTLQTATHQLIVNTLERGDISFTLSPTIVETALWVIGCVDGQSLEFTQLPDDTIMPNTDVAAVVALCDTP